MKIRIEMEDKFYWMLERGQIKKSWNTIEKYGVDTTINALFEETLDFEEVRYAIHKDYGVIEGFMYEGFYYGDIHINRVYVHENNDIILLGDGENMLILEDDPTCVCMFTALQTM